MRTTAAIILCCLLHLSVIAQQTHFIGDSYFASSCGTEQLMRNFRKDATFREKEWQTNQIIQQATSSALDTFTVVYTLPVVFHVVSNNPSSVTDAQLQAALQDLNNAFAHTGPYATGPGSNTHIQFCLAQKDPMGGNTTGITRTTSYLTDMDADMEDDIVKGLVDWDPTRYINIWCVSSIVKENLVFYQCGAWTRMNEGGYATMPGAAGSALDGIVVSGFGILLAHEMGHYLGLYHTFQGMDCKNNDCSTDGDMVCDTPPQKDVFSSPSCSQPVNSCSTDTLSGFTTDVPDLISNFMSYGNTPCINEFTDGQAARMRATIRTVRSSLLQQECIQPCGESSVASFTQSNPYPLPGNTVTFTNASTGATQFQWSVNGAVAAATPNFSYTFPATGTYAVTLKAYNTNAACYSDYSANVEVTCGTMARFYPNKQTIASKDSIMLDSIIFTNRSVNGLSYQWLLNDSIVGTSPNLTYTFQNPGTYTMRLVATNGSCTDTTEAFTIPVFDPTADGLPTLEGVHCYNQDSLEVSLVVCNNGYAPMPKGTPVSFYDSDPSTGQAHLLAGSPWYLPDSVLGMCCNFAYTIKLAAGQTGLNVLYAVLNDSGKTSPLHLPNTPIKELNYANNIVSASNFQFQLAMAPLDTTVMRKTSFPFRVTGTNGETFSLVWSPNPGYNLSCTNCPAPSVQVMDSSMVRVEATTQYGCTAFDSTLVYILPPDLTVQVNGADCYTNDSLLVHFTICMNNGYDSVWAGIPVSFAGGLDSFVTPAVANGSCATYTIVMPKPGGDTLFALVNQSGVIPETDLTNDGNAFAMTPFLVSIQPGDTSVPMGSLLPLTLSTSGGTEGGISWYPVNDLSCSDCASPELTVPYTQQYRVIVRNQYSCIDTAYAFIKSFTGGEVNIPSAFTPNGDGKNDIFYIMGGRNVLSIQHLAIFSRYGSVVFQSDNSLPNDPSQGWDGTTGGREAPPGTYVYMAIINFAEGRQQLYKGTVVLLR